MEKNNKENNEQLLQQAINKIEKSYGKGSIMKMGQDDTLEMPKYSSGSILFDKALGGGIPQGRIIEIFGPESSGKTSLTFQLISQFQKQGGKAAFIDAEHAVDLTFAKKLGVNTDDIIISQPDSGEQALEIVGVLVESGAFDLIVVDSVAALVPEIELKGEFTDHTIGAHARLMSKALRMLTPKIAKSNCTVIFINQIREKVGVMFGSPETTTGGRALKFYSSIRIDVRVKERIKAKDGGLSAQVIKLKVVKNKISEPYREAFLELRFDTGFNMDSELVDLASEMEIINKSGSWYSYNGTKIGQGKESVYEFFSKNKKVREEIEINVRKNLSK